MKWTHTCGCKRSEQGYSLLEVLLALLTLSGAATVLGANFIYTLDRQVDSVGQLEAIRYFRSAAALGLTMPTTCGASLATRLGVSDVIPLATCIDIACGTPTCRGSLSWGAGQDQTLRIFE